MSCNPRGFECLGGFLLSTALTSVLLQDHAKRDEIGHFSQIQGHLRAESSKGWHQGEQDVCHQAGGPGMSRQPGDGAGHNRCGLHRGNTGPGSAAVPLRGFAPDVDPAADSAGQTG